MFKKNYFTSSIVLSAGAILCSGIVNADCRMPNEQLSSLSSEDSTKLGAFHERIHSAKAATKLQLQATVQTAPASLPPPPTPPNNPPGNKASLPATAFDCSALFSWITDFYNSAFCHLKHGAKKDAISEHVECLSSYPGTPGALKASITGYSVSTDSAPMKAILEEISGDLADFVGEQATCQDAKTPEQFEKSYNNFLRAKLQLDKRIEEYDEDTQPITQMNTP